MGLLSKFQKPIPASSSPAAEESTPRDSTTNTLTTTEHRHDQGEKGLELDDSPVRYLTWRSLVLGVLVSMGGFIFGYDTGQISGFLEMSDFLDRYGENGEFSAARQGTIVGLLSIGTLIGAIISAPVADRVGRKYSITFWCLVFCVGNIVQIAASTNWVQIAMGRWTLGIGVGALSVMVPMYQSEAAPRHIRGALVSTYQLFITLGIFIAYCVNYGTEKQSGTAQWRIPMGIGFLWAIILGTGMLFMPESPRYAFRHGRTEEAKRTMTKLYGVPLNHREVHHEIEEIKERLAMEQVGGNPWIEMLRGPRMRYRLLLGMGLQSLQQLTGANFFFYYGTTIFVATGIQNSFITQMILGGINFGVTFLGLYVVEHFGRRKSLIFGAFWMFGCFLVFASVGHFALDQENPQNSPKAGAAMIVFACLFIVAYASTWGPIIWALIGEIYPSRYRAKAMAIATSANWTWNFLIAFFTQYITNAIDFRYGYVFAACCFGAAFVVYFFVLESQGRTLEEIDTMYILKVKPWQSSKWKPSDAGGLVTADKLALENGGRDIKKDGLAEPGMSGSTAQRAENVGVGGNGVLN